MNKEGQSKGLKEFSDNIIIAGPNADNACTFVNFERAEFDKIEDVFYTLGRWLVSRETLPDRNKCRIVEMELMSDFIDGANDVLNEEKEKT